jgi:hypothetical protein
MSGFMDELILQTGPALAPISRISGAYVFSGVQAICHRARLFVMTRTSKSS